MHAFSRLTTFFFFVLSLSIFAYALPAPGTSGSLSTRDAKCDNVFAVVAELKAKVDTCLLATVKADTSAVVVAQLELVVGHVNDSAHEIAMVGSIADMDVAMKADLAAKVSAIIAVILKACLKVSVKFGIQVLLDILVKIDAALKLLVVNVGACVDGVVVLIAKIVATTCAHIVADLNLKLCAEILVRAGVNISI
ncbi:hypothetical protein RSOLAG1IB_05681 [Rhizoctonia solani AG-1 IB]|uniref:Transmembrane protein n=1 Tax=Thanatephorus cucumeris (strain AG1-IB / isolate 7/3/14) TaxID=1108050 RepID=A0A0B7G119_THACB|nr:hypothetical protein RSOLAG1IB_05681 [Rhizoctonia solani AG-1 IB]